MDEPNVILRWVMFHFAGGDALYVGIFAVLAVSFLGESPASAWRWSLATLLAVIWGGLASPAWPLPLQSVLVLMILAWRVVCHIHGRLMPITQRITWSLRLVLIAALALESAMVGNRTAATAPESLCVIADSITAGLNDGEQTWPRGLAEQTGLHVKDASQPGATLRSAIKQAELLEDDQSPLVMEIGGNDLLSGLSVADFTRDGESLCRAVSTPGRTIWMCELPLPPFCSRYGVAQRRLCRQYGIRLIPKRKLMRLLTTSGATVDSIHLSPHGQELFRQMITQEIGVPTETTRSTGTYERCDPRRTGESTPQAANP